MTQEEKAKYIAMEATCQKLKERYLLLIRKVTELRAENERLKQELNAADAAFSSASDGIFAEIHRNHQEAGVLRNGGAGFRLG